jgi:hypothetical protein
MTRSGFGALPSVDVAKLNYLLLKTSRDLLRPDGLFNIGRPIDIDARRAPDRTLLDSERRS